jgi:beta-glucuronidase
MAVEKSGNYQATIHNTDYESEYLQSRLVASTLINITGRETESLNGKWNFAADLYDTCRRASWYRGDRFDANGGEFPLDYDWEGWDRIKVPASWNLEKPELHYFEGSGVYTRTFRYIPKTKGERLLLRFEGASYRTTVFLNGKIIGTHDGASTPFNADISDLVQTENRIVVTADARRNPLRIPMENTDWFNYGGIYRDVYLVRLPPVCIKDWFVRLAPDGTFSTVLADIEVVNHDKKQVNGKALFEIPGLNIRQEISIQNGKGEAKISARPELWSPENPKLYNVSITFNAGSGTDTIHDDIVHGDTVHDDIVRDRVGFREIKTKGHEIFLNGKKIFLRGVCVHEDHFALGKTTTEEIIRQTIRDLKEMNGNYLRLAHYPHDGRFARIADEEGVLLWEEIPVYWAVAFDNPGTYADAENQLSELILRDRNRASVIIWSVGNENADTDQRLAFMSRLAQKAKAMDGSRLVSAACLIDHEKLQIRDRLAEFLDVIGINEYYGWYDPDFEKLPKILANSDPGKPVLICEFGGDARLGQRGSVDDLWTEDKQERIYERQTETFKKCPYIAGTTPWILYDFRCPRRLNRYQEGFNRKGLIDADRKTRKPAFHVMRQFYGEMKP